MRRVLAGWRIEFVKSCYHMKLTLSLTYSPQQLLAWRFSDLAKTKNGVYSTRIAYRLLAETETLTKPGQSNPTAHNGFWKEIWSLNVPNKIKHFLWCACCKALPTKKNLFNRKVTRNDFCKCCGREVEDTIHALWECQVCKEIWWEVELCQRNLSSSFTCFRDLLTGIFQSQEPNLAEVFAYVAWVIWTKRNASRLGNFSIPY